MRNTRLVVEGYIRECGARGLAESTILGRTRELDKCGAWLKRRKPRPRLEEVDTELIIGYIRSRTSFHSKQSVQSVLTVLRSLGEHLVREGLWQKNPLRWMRGPKINGRLPRRIGKEALKCLWDRAGKNPMEYSRHLLLCVLALLYGTGIRRGEMERLELGDWDREEGILKVDGRKTGHERIVPVSEGVWKCVEAYMPYRQKKLEELKQAGGCEEKSLLLNRHGRRLTGFQITSCIARLGRSAGLEHVSPHRFRHSCASDLLESGIALPDIQKILGHRDITSTLRYAAIADPQRQEAMKRHPINRMLGETGANS